MIILSWNCRGLGHLSAVPSLRDLIRLHKPDIIFLCETLCHANKVEELRRNINFDSCFAVDREGRGGGLALMWKQEKSCEIQNYSKNFINVIIKDNLRQNEWRLTGFYGIPQRGQRRESWNILRMLSQQSHLPWCIIGDFNDILTTEDKRGNVPHPRWLLNGFRQAISDCDLIDVSIQGHAYTWARRLGHEDVVEERLDRALVNQSWMNLFPHCTLHNLVSGASDHSPILLNTEHQMYTYKKRQFRF
jgi:exonuclease III